jgi:two-component system, OmpR family, sensor histidine kinase BaeS
MEKLVHDLHELSLAQSQGLSSVLEKVDVLAILRDSITLYALRFSQAEIKLENSLAVDVAATVMANRDRLAQVYTNIFENTLRYTQAPGTLKIWSALNQKQVYLNFEDSLPGVPEEALNRLFERLYRLDYARSRKKGGSGLGLAICQGFVQAWGGEIRALPSSLGGLRIEIILPLAGMGGID